jgi:DNA ligase-1
MLVIDKGLDFLEAINSAKGTNAKKEILKSNLGIGNEIAGSILYNTFNPYISFNVVKVPKVKKENRKPISPNDAWELFFKNAESCAKREITGNAAINLIHGTFQQCSEAQEKWMRKILKKNLAIGVSTKSINDVSPGFIPTFDVALAQKFEHKRMSQWVYVEPKLDGIRCLAVVEVDDVKLFTRAGKLITNFDDTVGKELARLPSGAYDGEIMSNDFTDLMRQVYRKENKDVSDVYFAIFDYLTPEEWREKGTTNSLKTRKTLLKSFIDSAHKSENLKYLKQVRYEPYLDPSEAQLKSEHDRWVEQGYEGIMVKDTDAEYCFGRDWSVMKYKAFFDADVKVIGLQEGTGKHQGKLGSFLVDYKGVEVRVGSGLNDELREQIWGDQDSIVGRTIEVRYQEETPDGSLRFPTFVCFRNDK